MPDRRTFIASTAGALLAPGLVRAAGGALDAPTPGARPAPRPIDPDAPWIRKSLKYGMISGGADVREKFMIARDAGFDGVEMNSPNDLDTDDVLRAKEDSGLSIPGVVDAVHWSKPLSHPSAEVRAAGRHALETALLDCKAYGGTTVLLVPAVVNAGVSYGSAWERSIAEIRRVLPTAREARVSIAIENVWNNFLLSPLEAARYVDAIGQAPTRDRPGAFSIVNADGERRPVTGWYLDLGNLINYGWPEHWIEALGVRRILKIDVKDFSRGKRDNEGLWKGFGVKIGDGDVNWQGVSRMLKDGGYRGWASAEVGGGDLARLKDISARMDRVFGLGEQAEKEKPE